jgi:hypothetical protein
MSSQTLFLLNNSGSLQGRIIHEVIGSTQEGLHSIKNYKWSISIIKIDLSKAYDIVSWLCLRLLLLNIGFELPLVKWIMSCVTTTSFVVLINGARSPFFNSSRGIHEGFPLSPYLFLLLVDGLNRALVKDKRSEYFSRSLHGAS